MKQICLIKGRGTGKTHDIILMSGISGKHILVPDNNRKEYIEQKALEMNVEIPEVYTITGFKHQEYVGQGSMDARLQGLLVDELDACLEACVGRKIDAYSLTPTDLLADKKGESK